MLYGDFFFFGESCKKKKAQMNISGRKAGDKYFNIHSVKGTGDDNAFNLLLQK